MSDSKDKEFKKKFNKIIKFENRAITKWSQEMRGGVTTETIMGGYDDDADAIKLRGLYGELVSDVDIESMSAEESAFCYAYAVFCARHFDVEKAVDILKKIYEKRSFHWDGAGKQLCIYLCYLGRFGEASAICENLERHRIESGYPDVLAVDIKKISEVASTFVRR